MQCEPLQSSTAVSEVALSEHAPVTVMKAAAAPPVVMQASIPEGDYPYMQLRTIGAMMLHAGTSGKVSLHAFAVKRAAKIPQQGKEGAKEGVEGMEEAPPPDNRTWLQKNWVYMVPVIFMVGCMTDPPSTQSCLVPQKTSQILGPDTCFCVQLLNGLGGSAAQQRQGTPGQTAQAGGARQRVRQ